MLLSILTVLQFLYLIVYMPYVKGVVPNCQSRRSFLLPLSIFTPSVSSGELIPSLRILQTPAGNPPLLSRPSSPS